MTFSPFLIILSLWATIAARADLREDMKNAASFGPKASKLLLRNEIRPFWMQDSSAMIYRVNTGPNAHQFFLVDLQSGQKTPAFDHAAFASALASASSQSIAADKLPIEYICVANTPGVFRFRALGKGWSFDSAKKQVSPDTVPPQASTLLSPDEAMRSVGHSSGPSSLTFENATTGEIELFWVQGYGNKKSYGKLAPGESQMRQTYGGHVWLITDASGRPLAGVVAKDTPSIARVTGRIESAPRKHDDVSPDGQWRAQIRHFNLIVTPAQGGNEIPLTTDGSASDPYTGPFQWSPDSKKLSAWREHEVETRQIHIVQSSPPDQLQPKLLTLDYAKPGDEIRQPKPRLFDVPAKRMIPVSDESFKNPWNISHTAWTADSTEFSFVYNQRGHQIMRLLGVKADNGAVRTIFEDRSTTFIDYSQKFWMRRLAATREILWASERDGYNHLYLIDEITGQIKNPITQGNWNVREVITVDEEKRQLLLRVMGMPGTDPYFSHYVRIHFDGSGFTRLTEGDGNHSIEFSPDHKWIVDTWSRVDQPPVVEIRNAETGKQLTELERTDDSPLLATDWNRPEHFVAKGRDGTTDIHGIIIRPTHFDPNRKYPVLEDIYAGPHDFFVPKNYMPWSHLNAMAELGFIVVKIDGMGTNWRSKKFHDVCWKNLMDAGFPDRIPWIKAAAATRPWMDLDRVGIYGGSAGGQAAMAALLTHGEFYKAAVADCGCHDNRMDKIWWNEAWMGWPVDESYARNSNVTNAHKLHGALMLIVGEIDHNVDPASTAQVIAALEKAGKDFDYLPIMNSDHGAAESPYGSYRRAEFLIRHLHPAQ